MKILSNAKTYIGPIPESSRKALVRYMTNPSPTKGEWEDIAHLIINSGSMRSSTVWQALMALDHNFQSKIPSGVGTPDTRWTRAPDGFTVARAIYLALKEEK
jgi:hypothetical protein